MSPAEPRARRLMTPTALAAAALVSLLSLPALAQTAGEAGKDEKKDAKKLEKTELPQVTVTATRVATDALKTPVSVTALQGDELVRQNVKELLWACPTATRACWLPSAASPRPTSPKSVTRPWASTSTASTRRALRDRWR